MPMRVGLMVPQGWKGEYDGWEPRAAWARSLACAADAERLGFESLWVFDHFTTVPEPTDEITFESFTMLGGLSQATNRVRIGHMVVCTGFRNPALTAKMASTLDVMSGGRFELGIGAGWKEDEWVAYGYDFPDTPERLATLRDHLEVITRMLGPGRATFLGAHASVQGAINEPKGLQSPHVPIIVGGNGRLVTFRLAARFADELNFVYLDPAGVADAAPVARERCEEIGRDPASLRVSLYAPDHLFAEVGRRRVDLVAEYAELGLSRLIVFLGKRSAELETQAAFAEDVRAAGIVLDAEAVPAG